MRRGGEGWRDGGTVTARRRGGALAQARGENRKEKREGKSGNGCCNPHAPSGRGRGPRASARGKPHEEGGNLRKVGNAITARQGRGGRGTDRSVHGRFDVAGLGSGWGGTEWSLPLSSDLWGAVGPLVPAGRWPDLVAAMKLTARSRGLRPLHSRLRRRGRSTRGSESNDWRF